MEKKCHKIIQMHLSSGEKTRLRDNLKIYNENMCGGTYRSLAFTYFVDLYSSSEGIKCHPNIVLSYIIIYLKIATTFVVCFHLYFSFN